MTLPSLGPEQPLSAQPGQLAELRSEYAGRCTIALNGENHVWEAVWHPTPTSTCLSHAPDLAALAAKLNAEGWASG